MGEKLGLTTYLVNTEGRHTDHAGVGICSNIINLI